MATTTSITTTYAGKFLQEYIGTALLSAPTIEQGLVTVKPNIKYKEVIKKLATGGLLKDATCDFTATGSVTLTERVLTPKELQINQQLCKKDFRSDWDAENMGISVYDNLAPSFADFILARYAAGIAAENEVSFWRGATGTTGQYDGICTLIALDAALPTAQEVAGTTVTASNVLVELRKITAQIPATILAKEDLFIYLPVNMYYAYIQALGGFGASGLGANGVGGQGTQWYSNQALSIDGVKIVLAQGLASNVAIAAQKSNLYFGTGLLDDMNEVRLIDTSETLGDQNVRVVMRMTGCANYGFAEEIVTYGITNAAN
jgi:hypothetical protein